MKCRRAFTLIELLVVISVIAVLMAILLASLKRAVLVARQAVSAGNMRQIGIAIEMYADDNRGFFPETSHGQKTVADAKEHSWIYTLSSYLADVDKVRICPADPKRKERLENRVSSYILNEYIAVDNLDFLGRPVRPSYRNKLKLRNPAETITAFVGADKLSASITSDHTHSRQWFVPAPNVPWDTLRHDIQVDRYKTGTLFLYADSSVQAVKAIRIREMADNFVNFARP